MKRVVAIDFDGVIAHYEDWVDIHHIGGYIVGSLDLVEQLIKKGYEVWIYTTRLNEYVNKGHTTQELRGILAKWLNAEGFPVELQIYDMPGKPIADLYIDDRAYRHNTNSTWFQDEIDSVLKLLDDNHEEI